MEIEKKKRDPTVRNIERLAPETQVDTEVLENQAGLKTETQGGIQTLHDDTEADANSGGKGDGHNSSGGGRRRTRAPTPDQLKRKKYIIADADSDGSAAIEIGQSVTDTAEAVVQTGGTIRTAVQKSAAGIGKIHTMVKHGVRLGSARDVGKVAANIGSGIRTGIADAAKQTGTGLLKTKIDKSTTTDTGTEAIKKAGEELFFAYGEETGNRVMVYRFPNLVGKWVRPNYNSAVGTFCNNIANDLPITVNDPSVELEMLFIDDLVEEMFDAIEGKEHHCEFDGVNAIVQENGRYCYAPVTHKATLGRIVELLHIFHDQPQTLVMPEIPNGSFEKKLYSMYLSYLPKEKTIFDLKMNCDDRGSFAVLSSPVFCAASSEVLSLQGAAISENPQSAFLKYPVRSMKKLPD